MVQFVGFSRPERSLIESLLGRFGDDSFVVSELERVEKAEMPGYNGKVVPRKLGECGRFSMVMYLAAPKPFTIAHELAHVSDISTRRAETCANLSLDMPDTWHLAHRMTSEYYANRIACDYAPEAETFTAFTSDRAGLLLSARDGDWASFLIYYALLLGMFHGMGREDAEPLRLVPAGLAEIPRAVAAGIEDFAGQAARFFKGYAERPALAA